MLAGKVAVVTGSTSGIGLVIARALVRSGTHVIINGFGEPAVIESLRVQLQALGGGQVNYHAADMTKPDEIAALVEFAKGMYGCVDILVNNAGIQKVAPIEDFPTDCWDAILAVNLSSAFHAIRASVPMMKVKRWGRIINIASAHGLVASPFKSAYVAAKHGMVGLTKVVALELAQVGITCNAICPGYVRTPLVEVQIADTARARNISEEQAIRDVMLGPQPTKRFVETTEIAELVLFLCSKAGISITGTALSVDGGWTAQ